MPRIQPAANPDAKSQELLTKVKEMMGSTPNVFTTMANSSATLGVFVGAIGALQDSKLTPELKEQIAVAVAGANSCNYCASAHTALGKDKKISETELAMNLQAKSDDAKTQAALTFARKIVELRGNVSDTDLAEIRAAGFNDGEVIDILTVTCVNIFSNYFNHLAETKIDFPVVTTGSVEKAAA